jgi:ATP-binding cassette subfamily C protein
MDCLVRHEDMRLVTAQALLFAAATLVSIFFRFFAEILNQRLDASLVFLSSQATLRRFFAGSLDHLSMFEPAYLSSRLANDSRSFIAFLLNNGIDGLLALVQAATMLALIARLSLPVFAMTCGVLPLCAFVFYLFRRDISMTAAGTKEVAARYSAANQKQCTHYLFIKLNGLLDTSSSFVAGYFRKSLAGFLRYKRLCASLDGSIALLQLGATLFLFFAGGAQVLAGSLSIGSFTAINVYFAMLVAISGNLVMAGRIGVEARAAARRMEEILAIPGDGGGKARSSAPSRIILEKVSLGFGDDDRLFSGIDLEFERGRLYCICGENGCGKSSLLKLILGGYGGYGGRILVGGMDLRGLDLDDYRRHWVSYLPQNPVLFFEDVEGIISMGGTIRETADCKYRLSRLLQTDDPEAFIAGRLQGDGSSAEARFSGGERQKIALACACARESTIILADEPTAAMDAAGKETAAAMLRELAADRIVICVSHDRAVIDLADEIVELRGAVREKPTGRPMAPFEPSFNSR